ncbi:glucose-1-phosphate adenylyltransferase [Mobiluncus curtisii]|uniref:glucose-1-phosphate adenylyltransferase n=1 Tax=Mobiluncus curtisii TaxID=2051 RepID=UPI00242CF377|nr:glucose-1-phosphate adenylyltransferase [Mobiluncus curtisii]
MAQPKVLTIILAGGEGKRLMPLTEDRAKPAVPFGGHYRLIDFALSNVVNSGYHRVIVLTQYKSHSLDRHIATAWHMSNILGNYVAPVPAQQRTGKHWYMGSADAIFQSENIISDERPDYVLIIGADNIYRMDFSQMVKEHIESGLPATVAGIRQPLQMASSFGVIEADEAGKITAFREKPHDAVGLPDAPNQVLASMGNYVFNTDALLEALQRDSQNDDSNHDMGGDIVPYFVSRGEAHCYDFIRNDIPGSTKRDRDYWRDVGTIDAYYEASMDLIAVHPIFNLYNPKWPIMTTVDGELPPAKFVYGDDSRMGHAIDSFVSSGTIISGALCVHSIISPGVRMNSWSEVTDSVLMNGVVLARHAKVDRAILDKNVYVGEGVTIGVDLEQDRARGFLVTDSGITVVPKGTRVEQ